MNKLKELGVKYGRVVPEENSESNISGMRIMRAKVNQFKSSTDTHLSFFFREGMEKYLWGKHT